MNQVTLPVRNMDEATAYYHKLGFVQIVDRPHYARFECPEGGSTFSLSLSEVDFSNGAICPCRCPVEVMLSLRCCAQMEGRVLPAACAVRI